MKRNKIIGFIVAAALVVGMLLGFGQEPAHATDKATQAQKPVCLSCGN